MKHVFVVVLVGLTVALVPAAASGSAPPARPRNAMTAPTATRSTTPALAPTTAASPSGSRARPPSAATRQRETQRRRATPVNVGTTVLLEGADADARLHARSDARPALLTRRVLQRLTKEVICSPSFRTGTIRNVPDSEKHQVEVEYGMAPKRYGSTLEIDHIVSLELGGSNDIANLYPEKATLPGAPGFHIKDKLENAVHDRVCAGKMTLRTAQQQIAANWEALYKLVFGTVPTG